MRESRSPHGERGLKYKKCAVCGRKAESLPARGAWVEIAMAVLAVALASRRSPHRERGLKSFFVHALDLCRASLPARGAWVEMLNKCFTLA